MRTLLGLGMVLALTCGTATVSAEEKFDGKKLVGKWEPVKPKEGEAMMMEFTKDGKLTVTGKMGGMDVKIEGTYELKGDKLSFALKFMDIEIKEAVTITKLTDDEMEGKDKDGKVEAFKKMKAK